MSKTNEQVLRLFQETGLGDELRFYENPTLTDVDRMHFRHVLASVPVDTLDQPFRQMREGMLNIPLSSEEHQLVAMERQIGSLIDLLISEMDEIAQNQGFSLPYSDPDWLWRRIAFATMTYAEMEDPQPVMMNLMLLKVTRMIDGLGGLKRLEDFVIDNGYEYAPGENAVE